MTTTSPPRPLAVALYKTSSNPKLSPVQSLEREGGRPSFKAVPPYSSHTYLPIQQLCPNTCPLKNHGCFAQASVAIRRIVERLEQTMRAEGYTCDDVIEQEAALMRAYRNKEGLVPDDGAGGKRDLRLHTSGDVKTAKHARVLAAAAADWKASGGGSVFTFTHAWRWIPVEEWGPIAVRASCETPEEIELALMRSYAAALTTDFFPNHAATFPLQDGTLVRPCPAEAKGPTTCVECRYCVDKPRLIKIPVIAFEAHGRGQAEVRDTLYALRVRPRDQALGTP